MRAPFVRQDCLTELSIRLPDGEPLPIFVGTDLDMLLEAGRSWGMIP